MKTSQWWKKGLAITAATLLTTAAQAAVDISGTYLRVGAGSGSASGKQPCFKDPGAETKYRLGNECEIYGEIAAADDLWKTDDGVTFRLGGMLNYYNPYNATSNLNSDNNSIGLAQIYVEAKNIQELHGGKLWLGRKYYKREDIHTIDFFYWNPSGTGLGIEDINLGGTLKLSYALLRDNGDSSSQHGDWRHDLQLRGMNLNPGGQVNLGLSVIQNTSAKIDASGAPDDSPTHSGWAVSAQHKQKGVFGGGNTFAVQWGVGPGIGLGSTGDLAAGSEVKRFRVVEALYFQPTEAFGGLFTTVFERNIAPSGYAANGINGSSTWFSAGVRPTYAFTQHFKWLTDFGYDHVTPDGGAARDLYKITLGPALSLGKGFWKRPEFRLFYSYANWNSAAQSAASPGDPLSTTGIFGNKTSGGSFGAQVELWL